MITKSRIEGQKMIAIFYDNEQKPVKPVNFGEAGYPDYTISPHDEKRYKDISKYTKKKSTEKFNYCRRSIKIYIMGK